MAEQGEQPAARGLGERAQQVDGLREIQGRGSSSVTLRRLAFAYTLYNEIVI